MNEKVVKELMKESLLRTSEDFTERLMDRIEEKKIPYELPAKVKVLLVASLIVLFAIPLIWFRLTVADGTSSILFLVPFILLVFILINRYMNLSEAHRTV